PSTAIRPAPAGVHRVTGDMPRNPGGDGGGREEPVRAPRWRVRDRSSRRSLQRRVDPEPEGRSGLGESRPGRVEHETAGPAARAKFMRTLWVCEVAGGPQRFVATEPGRTTLGLEEAHRDLVITPD